jgi:pilus assembly protein CpaE
MAEALVRAAAAVGGWCGREEAAASCWFSGRQGRRRRDHAGLQFCRGAGPGVRPETLLIDLDLPLGDAALNLGIVAEYSTINALQELPPGWMRSFLSKLLVKHSSGVSVLAAPGSFPVPGHQRGHRQADAVARQEFDNVVVDVGSRLD